MGSVRRQAAAGSLQRALQGLYQVSSPVGGGGGSTCRLRVWVFPPTCVGPLRACEAVVPLTLASRVPPRSVTSVCCPCRSHGFLTAGLVASARAACATPQPWRDVSSNFLLDATIN